MPRIVIGILVGSVLIGGVIAIGAEFVYPVIIFPIIMGAGIGILVVGTTLRLKKHVRLIGLVLAITASLVMYSSYRYGAYLLFLRKLTGPTVQMDFGQYLRLTAAVGETLRIGTTEIELSEAATWAYWGAELLSIVVIAVLVVVLPRTRQRMAKAVTASESQRTTDGS
jgi:hypothetical protein